jgi:hypothetical protein
MTARIEATRFERDLVRMAVEIAADTSHQYSELMPARTQCYPLPFFGSLEQACVVTFGLNPSTGEFASGRNWSHISADQLADELVNYWTNEKRSPHPWFRPWSTVLAELGISYSSNASHIDLSPRATNSRRRKLRPLFIRMLQTDAPVWIEALRCAPKCRLVLAAGSATNDPRRGYINQFISEMLPMCGVRLERPWYPVGGQGQTVFHTLCLPGGRKIPFFFCSTGPTICEGSVLVSACREKMTQLRRYLDNPISNDHLDV